jgi:3-hydroxyacyl-[acyl-carrier-protein] dehydratase
MTSAGLDFGAIRRLLPHRPPMLLLDGIPALEPGRRLRAFLNVSHGGPVGRASAGGPPLLPRVFIIEAMGQAALALIQSGVPPGTAPPIPLFAGAEAVEFYGSVPAGSRLDLEVEIEKLVSFAGIVRGTASVDGRPVARMRLSAAVLAPGGPPGTGWSGRCGA